MFHDHFCAHGRLNGPSDLQELRSSVAKCSQLNRLKDDCPQDATCILGVFAHTLNIINMHAYQKYHNNTSQNMLLDLDRLKPLHLIYVVHCICCTLHCLIIKILQCATTFQFVASNLTNTCVCVFVGCFSGDLPPFTGSV